mmetsp:Transcript_10434/g.25568  ORF Transcript_10434/g.25568 Transcript_10434/m.25568 type:complete len:169 (-) Transcript_10434:102-608(-)
MGAGSSSARAPPAPAGSIVVTNRLVTRNPASVTLDNYLEEGGPSLVFNDDSYSAPASSPSTSASSPAPEAGVDDQLVAGTGQADSVRLQVLKAKNEMLKELNQAERARIKEKTEQLRQVLQLDTLRKAQPHPCLQEENTALRCLEQKEDLLRCAQFIDEYSLCAAKVA